MLIQIYNLFSGFLLFRTPSLQTSDEPNIRTLELTHVLGTVSFALAFCVLVNTMVLIAMVDTNVEVPTFRAKHGDFFCESKRGLTKPPSRAALRGQA